MNCISTGLDQSKEKNITELNFLGIIMLKLNLLIASGHKLLKLTFTLNIFDLTRNLGGKIFEDFLLVIRQIKKSPQLSLN